MVDAVAVQSGSWPDVPSRSPWFAQLSGGVPQPLTGDTTTDVAIVGAGIAGVATAFFVLRETDQRVLVLERNRAGSGATGHNAGQVANYFERPLCELVDDYGFDRAIAAQAAIDDAFELLTLMIAESGSTVRLEQVMGHMGMFSLNHLDIHLRNQWLRRRGGLAVEECLVADDAPFVAEIPIEYSELFRVVPRADIEARLGRRCGQYYAVLSAPKACVNSALVVEHTIAHLATAHPNRFRFVDHTMVDRITLGDTGAELEAGGHRVECGHVVLCTNGYLDHTVLDAQGSPIELPVIQTVGYMGAYFEQHLVGPCAISYIKNDRIGGELPYGYVTRRTYDRPEGPATLTCVGGPETELEPGVRYDLDAMVPGAAVEQLDTQVRAVIEDPGGSCEAYDYTWHGLMAYMPDRLRVVGFEPRNPALMYNLACNGVGILPSLHGGQRIARLLAGHELPPSLFDPRE
jgi:glycine/D-amino acid oxidase-like deaminating enzyme